MKSFPTQPRTPSAGPNNSYFGARVTKLLILCGSAAVAGILTLVLAFWPRRPKLPTISLVKEIGYGYDKYRLDGGDVSDFSSQKEWIDRILHNPRGIVYFSLARESFDDDEFVIDTWGRRLRIKGLESGMVDIRSAGRDGKFDTSDDVFSLHPKEKTN